MPQLDAPSLASFIPDGAFLRLLRRITQQCEEHNLPTSFCGEIEGGPLMALTLVRFDYRRLSVRPATVGLIKRTLRTARFETAREEVQSLLEKVNDESVRDRFAAFAADAG